MAKMMNFMSIRPDIEAVGKYLDRELGLTNRHFAGGWPTASLAGPSRIGWADRPSIPVREEHGPTCCDAGTSFHSFRKPTRTHRARSRIDRTHGAGLHPCAEHIDRSTCARHLSGRGICGPSVVLQPLAHGQHINQRRLSILARARPCSIPRNSRMVCSGRSKPSQIPSPHFDDWPVGS